MRFRELAYTNELIYVASYFQSLQISFRKHHIREEVCLCLQ